MQCISLQYFYVFGQGQDPASPYSGVIMEFITNSLFNRPLVIFGDGKQTRDFVYVNDFMQANLRTMEKGTPCMYNIGRGTRVDLRDPVNMITEITSIYGALTYGHPAKGDEWDSLADISRARETFGYAPTYAVMKRLIETIGWFRNLSRSRYGP